MLNLAKIFVLLSEAKSFTKMQLVKWLETLSSLEQEVRISVPKQVKLNTNHASIVSYKPVQPTANETETGPSPTRNTLQRNTTMVSNVCLNF